eukprot:22606-Eustigmatos_ZCMA.PRE.1
MQGVIRRGESGFEGPDVLSELNLTPPRLGVHRLQVCLDLLARVVRGIKVRPQRADLCLQPRNHHPPLLVLVAITVLPLPEPCARLWYIWQELLQIST